MGAGSLAGNRSNPFRAGALFMPSQGSVSRLIDGLAVRDEAAVEQLWRSYFRRLVGLARRRLRGAPRRLHDEEDVALSAFASFCRAAELGRFPQLLDREGLWRLLVVITVRKAAHVVRDEGRRPARPFDAEELLSREPSPDLAAVAAEEHRRLLGRLDDPELEAVATLRMENYSVEDIAAHLHYTPRTIKRRLALIRATWEGELLAREGCRRGC
jgi:DNA-directed RNA polymerase specialized sigma24 family protein